MHYIRIVRLIIFCLLLPLAVQAKREKVDMPDKPVVSDSILQCISSFRRSIPVSLMSIRLIYI